MLKNKIMKRKYKKGDGFIPVVKQENLQQVPVNYNLIRAMRDEKTKPFKNMAPSDFHQTEKHTVHRFYKPIACLFKIEHQEFSNE